MKTCPGCQPEMAGEAMNCPRCGADQRTLFGRGASWSPLVKDALILAIVTALAVAPASFVAVLMTPFAGWAVLLLAVLLIAAIIIRLGGKDVVQYAVILAGIAILIIMALMTPTLSTRTMARKQR